MHGQITFENDYFRLTIEEDCTASSLIEKVSGEECLAETGVPLFSLTEPRPFNNEIKLGYPNKRTTFNACRVRKEADKLIVGFELIGFEAVVSFSIKPQYITFTLEDFIVPEAWIGGLTMDFPPVSEFRLLQLSVKKREHFGQWLNVCWDDKVAVNVLGTSPYPRIDFEKRKDSFIMSADAVREIKLKGCSAALIVSPQKDLLDCVEAIEEDFDLPRGVKSRRSPYIHRGFLWANRIAPHNVDEYIEVAKKCGVKMLTLYVSAFLGRSEDHGRIYDTFNDEYPNGLDDVAFVVKKLKEAGLTVGFHFLHPHIGLNSDYCRPVADHRLRLKQHFTLAKGIGTEETTIYVEENPHCAPMHEKCRVLKFGGELIRYEGYTTEYPYYFYGCERGYNETYVIAHETGKIGGILDITEYGGNTVYLDQNSSLQDEIADMIAKIYDTGIEYIYYDGSEGTNEPYDFHVSNAQYRVYKKLNPAPIFCEGAAKTHFGWHILSGGNGFDYFEAHEFKEKIVEFPVEEAPRLAEDFTRLNFGWWNYFANTQPDMFEFGMSRAAAWDCPVTLMVHMVNFKANARTEDNFEVMRRWNDVIEHDLLTEEQKEALKDAHQEHILLINEAGAYELLPYDKIELSEAIEEAISAYIFERAGKSYVVCWHKKGSGKLLLLTDETLTYEKEIGKEEVALERTNEGIILPVAGRCYLSAQVEKEKLAELFKNAQILQ